MQTVQHQVEQDLLLCLAMLAIFEDLFLSGQVAMRGGTVLHKVHLAPAALYSEDIDLVAVGDRVTERTPHFPVQRLPFPVQFRGANLGTEIVSYNINEMLATKMRALFQRKKGRDLFDLYWALSVRSALPVSVAEILQAFDHYMKAEGELVPRENFIAHLRQCLADRAGFCTDLDSFLRRDLIYDPDVAGALIERDLLGLLPV
jgi:predicted nucleotidyltransferase component of viral defense system